jgi:CBS domain-containing protein
VDAGAPFEEVVERLIDNRRSSVVVVDGDRRPIGRILADDVVDALVPGGGRLHFPRLLS